MSKQSNNPSTLTGTVLNIQRYCSHDGPGIRTNGIPQGLFDALQVVQQSRKAFPPETGACLRRPKLCTGKKECGLCLKSPFPEGRISTWLTRRRRQESASTGTWPLTAMRR